MCSTQFLNSQTLISSGKTAWSSDVQGANIASKGIDGLSNTRWESKHSDGDNAWWAIDFGQAYHISRVEFDWEGAYASEYAIDISNDQNFNSYTEIAYVANGQGKTEIVSTDINTKGRYLRFRGIKRKLGYGYSFWECRIYGMEELTSTNIQINVPYVQYLKLKLTPGDLNDNTELTVQNKDEIIQLRYNVGTPLNIDLLDFRGDFFIDLWALPKSGSDTIKGIPFSTVVFDGLQIYVKLTPKITFGNQPPVADAGKDIEIHAPINTVTLDGSRSQDRDGEIVSYKWTQLSGPSSATILSPNAATTDIEGLVELGNYKFKLTVTDNENATGTDEVVVSILPPEQIDFNLVSPVNKSMITDTRRPQLSWQAVTGASKYEIFVNITRDDYEWHSSGNLLDRYTKVGESTTNSFTLNQDLVDRWTYKWYVVATTSSGQKYSNKSKFGLYIPYIEQMNDGIDIVNGCRDMNKNGTIEPFEDWHLTPEERLTDLMNRLTTEEKVRQLFYGGNNEPLDGFAFSYGVESGMRDNQFSASQTRMGIPIAFLGDKIHGWKTIYPTQLGLAATRDMNLVYQCGNLHRIEQKSFGFTGTLAPLAEVGTKVLYPRLQEGSGENADEAAAIIRAIVCGMQGGPELNPHSMLITVKHWPSQGAGGEGPTQYDATTIKYHMKPWHAAVEANAASVMPGYSSSPFLDPSGKGANSSKKIIDYLRNEIKFNGFIETDWLGANTNQSIESIGAGIDVLGGAPSAPTDIDALIAAVGIDRINEAAARVLDTKIRMGMFENPYGDPTCTWTSAAHHNIVLNAARKTVTLLTNNDNLLPLQLENNDGIVVGGPRATWAHQNNDPNVIWQSIYYDNKQTKNYVQAITDIANTKGIQVSTTITANTKVGIVVIGENGYTHGTEWRDKNPNIPEDQLEVIQAYKNAGLKVITVVILPRPYVLTPVVELSDAVFVVYRGGNGIAQATAEAIFGEYIPSGKLPFQLPRSQDQVGTDNLNNQIEKWELPYDIGATNAERALIRSYIEQDLPVPPIFGDPLFQYGHGLQNYGKNSDIPTETNKLFPHKEKSAHFNIYPNPTISKLFITPLQEIGSVKLEISDLSGRAILRTEVNNEQITIDVSNLPSGLYFLYIQNDKYNEIKTFIKK